LEQEGRPHPRPGTEVVRCAQETQNEAAHPGSGVPLRVPARGHEQPQLSPFAFASSRASSASFLAFWSASSARFWAWCDFCFTHSLACSAFSLTRLPIFFAVSETAFPASVSLPPVVSAMIGL